ncbi:MAG TPA: hypothetical protein LFV66_06710 [Rickettsia endosymbiont of Bembidion lapponicum]|nr:hypothetical protein [Rickettsia endosymbiont of Bembidion lapponicum]
MMKFDSYKEGTLLDLENADLKEPDIPDLLEYLSNNHQVTQLKLAGKYINDGIIQNLVNSSNIQNLTDINFINCIYITDKGIEALANSPNMQNLTSINFQYCYKITNKGIEALADSQNIQNLSSISFEDCYKITDKGVESLVNSPNMQNLTSINLGGCNITDKALTDLTNSSNMQNITSINFRGTIITDKALRDLANSLNMQNITNINFKDCNDITNKGITDLVNSSSTKNLTIISLSTLMSIEEIEDIVKKLPKIQELKIADDNGLSEFCNYLIQLRDFESNSDFNKEERIKDIMFSFAQQGKDEYIKYILNNQEKYPFLVNTKDEYDHNLMHFYTHDPEMQKLFFEKGMIPSKEIDPDNIMLSIVNDAQSVHTSEVTKRTNFFTNELVQVFSDNYIKLTEEAEKYKSERFI